MQLSAPHYCQLLPLKAYYSWLNTSSVSDYRIFDDALAIELKSSIPNDPFTGRVLASPIRAPRTIDLFRRAIAVLESISLSRLGCIFDYEESELTDGLAGETPLPILSLNLPGTTKEQPFFIVLSRIINGVAEPYLSSTDKNQLLYLEKPLGWVERNYVPESTWVGEREGKTKQHWVVFLQC